MSLLIRIRYSDHIYYIRKEITHIQILKMTLLEKAITNLKKN